MKSHTIRATSGAGKTTLIHGYIVQNVLGTNPHPMKLLVIDFGGSYRHLANSLDSIQYIDLNDSGSVRVPSKDAKCIVVDMPAIRDFDLLKPFYDYVLKLCETMSDRRIIIDEVSFFDKRFIKSLLALRDDTICVVQDSESLPDGYKSEIELTMHVSFS